MERVLWWGGFFERMVGSVKRCFRKILGNVCLLFDEFLIVLSEVEVILNFRFLMYDYDILGEEVLIFVYLIYGRRFIFLF